MKLHAFQATILRFGRYNTKQRASDIHWDGGGTCPKKGFGVSTDSVNYLLLCVVFMLYRHLEMARIRETQ